MTIPEVFISIPEEDIQEITRSNQILRHLGPVIGHCSPEAADGGPIALIEEGDLIEIDVMDRRLNIIGIRGERKTPEEIDAVLAERKKNWVPKERKYKKGVLRLFSEHAASPMKGAYLEY